MPLPHQQVSKILIVDDEPFNVDLLEQELEDLGYRTSSAGDGQEALGRVPGVGRRLSAKSLC